MGRRANNPELVQELIDRRWDESLGEDEYNEKYFSLSSSDMSKVAAAIDSMEKEFLGDDEPECAGGCGGYPESCMGCNLGGNR